MSEMRVVRRGGVPVELPDRASLLIEIEPVGSIREDFDRQQRLVAALREAGYSACGWMTSNVVRVILT